MIRSRPSKKGHVRPQRKGRVGSSFDDFLKEEGIYEEATARAIKRVVARQRDALMRGDRGASELSS
jgi:hypothetical protein